MLKAGSPAVVQPGRGKFKGKCSKENALVAVALKKLGNTSASDTDFANELRNGYDKLRSNKKRMSGD